MANTQRSLPPYVISALQFRGASYNFFQAARLLKRLQAERGLIGHDLPAVEEGIRFQVSNSLVFPKRDLTRIQKTSHPITEQTIFEIETAFLGLHGVSSPLPSNFVHDLAQGGRDDNVRKQFFDFFHHRLLSLFYRSWEKYRYFVVYNPVHFPRERTAANKKPTDIGREDEVTRRIFALLGLYFPELRRLTENDGGSDSLSGDKSRNDSNGGIPWIRLLSFSGLIASRSRSPSMLSGVLGAVFLSEEERDGTHLGIYKDLVEQGEDPSPALSPAKFQAAPFLERRVNIPTYQQWCLGKKNSSLAEDTILGRQARDIQGKFAFQIGPLTFNRFMDFLPSGKMHQPMKMLLRFLLKEQNAVDLNVEIDMQDSKEFVLDKDSPLRLGWSTFLGHVHQKSRQVPVTLMS